MLGVSIFTGIYYWIMKTDVGYGITHAIRQPLFSALFIGLIMGKFTEAIIIGAAVQILYIGLVAAGSNLPADDCLAGLIAIPIALQSNLTPAVAITIAVPVGVIGVFLDQFRKTINIVFVHMADRFAAKGNQKQVVLSALLYPTLLALFYRFPVPFFANLYGANAVTAFMKIIPQWLINGFGIMGGILPALGFALTMFVIGSKQLLPWFFIGFFLVEYSKIPVMGAAIFGIAAIILISMWQQKKGANA
ncbi:MULTISPECIES: PTS mannose/fructose/sorbose/N-acetylgalactosamine transporter subunit IIC [unclassified Sporolactobacillus]|uniref:PTS mannose/fructose/sorbose/N-acetylgalactosamine transporter subunit IIC n=1 Tax=unclassified Sporolactobacillus TaxID=2628533 RepID=UPI00236766AA|nr:PTS sugar transporter subunit IIC [Sporolactobacillus sp. CQH2019]MDD9148886.1 PTS sugar transporter subunit IIC [Sporolactobacillus sp. CQH2019]